LYELISSTTRRTKIMSKTIGSFQIPPTHGQVAANFAGNAAQTNKPFVSTNATSYLGVGVPVYSSASTTAAVGAFSTFPSGAKPQTGIGAGFRFHF